MVAMGHGLCVSLCVCGETTKNKVGPKKHDGALELLGHLTVSDTYKEVKDGLKVTKCWCDPARRKGNNRGKATLSGPYPKTMENRSVTLIIDNRQSSIMCVSEYPENGL